MNIIDNSSNENDTIPDISKFNLMLSDLYSSTKWDKHKDFTAENMKEAMEESQGKLLAQAFSLYLLCDKYNVDLYKGEDIISFQKIEKKSERRSSWVKDFSRYYLEVMEKYLGTKKGIIRKLEKYGDEEDAGLQILPFVKWLGETKYTFKAKDDIQEKINSYNSADTSSTTENEEVNIAERKQQIRQEKK